jgi:pantetheine-phosphate adenylyltransferase
MQERFNVVAVGGTFDELHKGHKALLMKAFEVGQRVLIGLCSDEFVKQMEKQHEVAPYQDRLEELKTFLRESDLLQKAEIVPLNDAFGMTLRKGCMDALIVSKETEPTAMEINKKRKTMGLGSLEVIVVNMIPSGNHTPICTTRIRRGEMDREGRVLR